MALKNPEQLFKSSFTEDDVYFYDRDEDLDSRAEEALSHSDFADPLWFLHPSDEDNRFVRLGDYMPKKWGSSNQSSPRAA